VDKYSEEEKSKMRCISKALSYAYLNDRSLGGKCKDIIIKEIERLDKETDDE